MRILAPPFADYCNITFPADSYPDVLEGALGVLYGAGAHAECEGLLRLGDGGTVRHKGAYGVGWLGFSGSALASLRGTGTGFRDLCGVVAGAPHRVTRLDVALDVIEDAPPILRGLWRRGRRGCVALTRKVVPRHQVGYVSGASLTGPGATGTVYLGKRRRDVSAAVYDKRQELLCRAIERHGHTPAVITLNDPGPLTRFELRLGRHVGCTLRDFAEPAAVFWHHMGRSILRAPDGVEPWQASAEGYELPPRPDPNYVRQMELILERSPDVGRLVAIADKLGPYGRDVLRHRFGKRIGGLALGPA